MRTLGLIPARAGSVRLPRKNVAQIGNRSLVEIAADCGIAAGLDLVCVSTDDSEIMAMLGGRVEIEIIPRPSLLAHADTAMLPVVHHAVRYLNQAFDAIVLLQPTSPLRTADDVTACLTMLRETGGDAVVSVTDGADDVAFHVRFAHRLEKIPDIVVPNGAVYVLRTSALEQGHDWFSGVTYAYRMPKDRSVDIDTQADLDFARFVYDRRRCVSKIPV